MQMAPDCVPCILRVLLSAVRSSEPGGPGAEKDLFAELLRLPALAGEAWETTPPEAIEEGLARIRSRTGVWDPFRRAKEREVEGAKPVVSALEEEVRGAPRPLEALVGLWCAGNALDLMVHPEGTKDVEGAVRGKLDRPIQGDGATAALELFRTARRVVCLGDNAGEAVFDRLAIETLAETTGAEVTYVVRGEPTLNDVTEEEARWVGLDKVCRVIPNGIRGPLPGTILARCSEEVRERVRQADLVLSKGGGNLDTVHEYGSLGRPTVFLFQAKCAVHERRLGVATGGPVVLVGDGKPAGAVREGARGAGR
ncbi:MAG: DUF89 domain-containing protein [Deferrisomatales bacterium]